MLKGFLVWQFPLFKHRFLFFLLSNYLLCVERWASFIHTEIDTHTLCVTQCVCTIRPNLNSKISLLQNIIFFINDNLIEFCSSYVLPARCKLLNSLITDSFLKSFLSFLASRLERFMIYLEFQKFFFSHF